jgi:hypothetical protein
MLTSVNPTARRRSGDRRSASSKPIPTPNIARVATTKPNVGRFRDNDFISALHYVRSRPCFGTIGSNQGDLKMVQVRCRTDLVRNRGSGFYARGADAL